MLRKLPGLIVQRFNQFLYGADSQVQLGVFRFLLTSTLLYIACFRQFNIDLLGESSFLPREMALQVFPDFYRPVIQWFFWPDSWVYGIHTGLIGLLLLAVLGLTNRPLLFLTWIFHQGILNRNYAILYGADVIGSLFLFYLCFTKCNHYFSLKHVFLKGTTPSKPMPNKASISQVFFRLIQIQICVIYMYTGFEKLKGSSWWDGTALWTVFANPQFIQIDLKFLSHVPVFFAAGTFLSIIFEVYFPAMMLQKRYRLGWLTAGIFFHLGIGILLGLMTFSMVMVSTYILFLEKELVVRTIEGLKIMVLGRFTVKTVSK